MKYIIYLLAAMYIIWWFYIINFFMLPKEININEIKKSIVIITPEKKIISYKNNPKWLFEKYKTSGIWAGFFIDNTWTIKTVSHILWNSNIVLYNWKKYSSKIIKNDTTNDSAILKINIKNNSFLNYWKLKKNNKIISFWVNPQELKIIYNTWIIINKNSNLDNMNNLIEISNTLKPGFSGWPIINLKWKVIWINYAISEWKNYWINLTEKKY